MKLIKRIVNRKGHTRGYVNGSNHRLRRSTVVAAAKKGNVDGVLAVKGKSGWYVTADRVTVQSLAELPAVQEHEISYTATR